MSLQAVVAALALLSDVPLEDAAKEARAQALMREIRCVACENEPVSQSAAPIAEDMRTKIRELVADGASDTEVRAWFADRYGEFVLFRPRTNGFSGWVLWGAPLALLAAGGVLATLSRRRGGTGAIAPVAAEDLVAPDDDTHA